MAIGIGRREFITLIGGGCVLVQAARCSRLEIFCLEGSRLRHYLGVFAPFQIRENIEAISQDTNDVLM